MERVKHESLVPSWVRFWICKGAWYARPANWMRKDWLKFSAAIFTILLIVGFVSTLPLVIYVRPYQGSDTQLLFSLGLAAALATIVSAGVYARHEMALRWLRKNWKSATGEESLEHYLPLLKGSDGMARITLTNVARRVQMQEIKAERFHVARDIAALYWLCDEELRMRDLLNT